MAAQYHKKILRIQGEGDGKDSCFTSGESSKTQRLNQCSRQNRHIHAAGRLSGRARLRARYFSAVYGYYSINICNIDANEKHCRLSNGLRVSLSFPNFQEPVVTPYLYPNQLAKSRRIHIFRNIFERRNQRNSNPADPHEKPQFHQQSRERK